MSDPPDPLEALRLSYGRAFGLSFGLCAAPPLLLYALMEPMRLGIDVIPWLLIMPAVTGLGMLVFDVVQKVRGNEAGGGGLILGALAGVGVGDSLCIGSFTWGSMN